MKINASLMATVAATLLAAPAAHAAVSDTQVNAAPASSAAQPMVLAQNTTYAPSYAALESRIDALEEELQSAEMRAAKAENTPPTLPSGWWSNTSISGRMYWDATNIQNKANGVKVAGNGNGTNFDIKRFYVGIDHTFNNIFSANVTTDTTYDSGSGAGQIYIKKAYLQAKIDPALTIRIGSADLPWVPYVEGLYGYRYLENVMIDHTKFGTSADWGNHSLRSLFEGRVN